MKNLFKKTEFVFGVTSYKNLPEDIGYEILLAGRSNAGKSIAIGHSFHACKTWTGARSP